jgi:Protein of unknown function (DUF5131)
VTGCRHGCDYCYARELATSERLRACYPVGFTPLFHHERPDAPANTAVPKDDDPAKRRVFVCSMADLYGRWVPKDWIEKVHASAIENPQWTYIHLTKFPNRYLDLELPPTAWIGASVDKQNRVKVTEEAFRQIEGVAVKWLSCEPLLGPVKFTDLSVFDWVVIGAQTQTNQPEGAVPAFAPGLRVGSVAGRSGAGSGLQDPHEAEPTRPRGLAVAGDEPAQRVPGPIAMTERRIIRIQGTGSRSVPPVVRYVNRER